MTQSVLARRLGRYVALSAQDEQMLEEALRERVRRIGPREDVFREGEPPRAIVAVLDGWAMRTKSLEDGRRQVVSLALPGDTCEHNKLLLDRTDHGLTAVTSLSVAEISGRRMAELSETSPRLHLAFAWSDLVGAAMQREWTVNLGQRSALERMAHLVCELFFRLRAIGQTSESGCELPVTQAMLADAMGISAVHVNRTLQELRASNLITLRGKNLVIHDLEALMATAQFNPGYLHLDEAERAAHATSDAPVRPPLPAAVGGGQG